MYCSDDAAKAREVEAVVKGEDARPCGHYGSAWRIRDNCHRVSSLNGPHLFLCLHTLFRKENGFNTSIVRHVPTLVQKWGPSIQTIMNLARAQTQDKLNDAEEQLEQSARSTASLLYRNDRELIPFLFIPTDSQLDKAGVYSVLFIQPVRDAWEQWTYCTPTEYLRHIIENARGAATNEQALWLFWVLGAQYSTRSSPGWRHELDMHSRLCTGNVKLYMFKEDTRRMVEPSAVLLPGMLESLGDIDKDAGAFRAFYWIPSIVDCPGVDAVLGDDAGNVYVLQAVVQGEQRNPAEGLRRVWKGVSENVRARRSWHFVVVANTDGTADEYRGAYLNGLELGRGICADVWIAIL